MVMVYGDDDDDYDYDDDEYVLWASEVEAT
jgi:hypothetical protein